MPRAPAGPTLLLMAALAFAAAAAAAPSADDDDDALTIINPWLSACDLMQPASTTDLKGACSAMWGSRPPFCPLCPSNNNNNNRNSNSNSTTQCLYLHASHKTACGRDPETRRRLFAGLRMRHCCDHQVADALPPSALQRDAAACERTVDALLQVDELAARISCEFAEVLDRYDCGQKYSIKHRCDDCKEAYRRWVCSSMVPHYCNRTGLRVRPCLSVCQRVEEKCPYMLPGDRAPAHPTQYAGEPTFLCLDPNIPETGEQRRKSSVGDEDCCYKYSECGGGGGGGGGNECLHIECPRGPVNISVTPVNCSAGIGNGTLTCISTTTNSSSSKVGTAGVLATSAASRRTFHKVLGVWTAWLMLIQIIPTRVVAPPSAPTDSHLVYSVVSTLRYISVLVCATSVRTSLLLLTRVKTKRRRKPWS